MNTAPKSLCILCGSKSGDDPAFGEVAAQLGKIVAKAHIRLIYGGGGKGLMGQVAKAALSAGGEVIGVMPRFLREREIQQEGLSRLILTETLTERKLLMTQMADAIAALPGGFGTLDELTEIASWKILRVIDKPIVLVNVRNFWSPFLALMDHAIAREFSSTALKGNFKIVKEPGQVLAAANLSRLHL